MYSGITFDGKHSYNDFGLTVSHREIGHPSKIKRQERVPFSNEVSDYSEIYGEQEYEERPLTYTFNDINTQGNDKFLIKATEYLNWLMKPNKKIKLTDDRIPGYFFLAEVVNAPSYEYIEILGEMTIEFTAYPFKVSELEEGHDIWDEFNFLLDYAQITEFEVTGSKEITLYNPGINIAKPKIVASDSMTITKDNVTFNVSAGESKSSDFVLFKGENKMTVTGNGTISFHFRKELI